jgi:teichuronic acid biosynthesis glycosyltransferase TuaC
MLRIAVVTHYFPSSAEPWQGRSAYQTLRLIAQKADVQVFYPNSSYPSILKSRSRRFTLDHSWSVPDVKTKYYDYPALPVISRPFNGDTAARVLLPHVSAFAPDLIFSCVLYPHGYTALKIAGALSVPAIAMSIGSDVNRIGDAISAMHTRTVLRKSDFVITVCDDLRKKAVSMGARPERARAILNGCDLGTFHVGDRQKAREKLGIDPAVHAIVYVGRMDVKKGLRELVEASALLQARRPNLHVYLIGDGQDQQIVQSAIEAANASGYIHLYPSCTFDDVALWMSAADVAALPSYMEGCPNVVLEALACGRPVVATNVGGIPEIMNDSCGCLVPPQDAAALAEGLNSVLDRSWDPAEISAVHSRSWHAVADETLTLFESLVNHRQLEHR